MKVGITGAGGFVGRALTAFLTGTGDPVVRVARSDLGNPAALAGMDAVVHLAGENIGAGRWTAARKAAIRDSRTDGTRRLAEALAALPVRPRVLVSVSGVGYYGDRGDEILTEESPPGNDFLAGVCVAWEANTAPAAAAGIRVVILRFGSIFDPGGGVLGRLLPIFRLGLGGRLGSGRQWMSWIALDDALGAFRHALTTPSLHGPVNGVGRPVTNREFTRALAGALHRPAILPVPRPALELAYGEMARSLLFSSQRVEARKLAASGYQFRYPELDGALRAQLAGGP